MTLGFRVKSGWAAAVLIATSKKSPAVRQPCDRAGGPRCGALKSRAWCAASSVSLASEGRLFRSMLVDGLERCGVSVRVVLEREVYELLGKTLRRSP
jgi:hypothetical protein